MGGGVGTETVAIGVVSRPPGEHKEHFCNCLLCFIIGEVKLNANQRRCHRNQALPTA